MSSYGILKELWKEHEGKKMYTFVNSHQTFERCHKNFTRSCKAFHLGQCTLAWKQGCSGGYTHISSIYTLPTFLKQLVCTSHTVYPLLNRVSATLKFARVRVSYCLNISSHSLFRIILHQQYLRYLDCVTNCIAHQQNIFIIFIFEAKFKIL